MDVTMAELEQRPVCGVELHGFALDRNGPLLLAVWDIKWSDMRL
jgi:hypothetical protein